MLSIADTTRLLAFFRRKIDRSADSAEGMFDSAFSKIAGKRPLQPRDVEKAIIRALDAGVVVFLNGFYIPNRIYVSLNPADMERISLLLRTCSTECAKTVKKHIKDNMADAINANVDPKIELKTDSAIKEGVAFGTSSLVDG